MARAIDAELLKENCKITGEFMNNFECVSLATLGEIIDNQPTIEPKQEWISVKDRLPPDGNKPYLTCRKTVKGRTVIESRYLHTSYESPCVAYWEGKKNGEVTHWMPLPEPPERDDE